MRLSKKLAIAAVSTVAAISVATAAFAYWTTSGGGSGSVSAASDYSSRIVVNQLSAPTGLVPGGAAKTLSGDFANSNPGDVSIVSVSAEIKNSDGTPWSAQAEAAKPACTKADFAISALTVSDPLVLAGSAHDGAWSGTIALLNGAGNQDNCKGVTPPIQYVSN